MIGGLEKIDASWWSLLWTSGVLIAIYIILRFFNRLFGALTFSPWLRGPGKEILRKLLVLFEPVSFLLVVFLFVFIHPLEHGLIVALLIAILFPHLRNYLTGRLVVLENDLKVDDWVTSGKVNGKVLSRSRLGIKILGEKGPFHLGYMQLLADGYEKLSGYASGEYVRFQLEATPEANGRNQHRQIMHILSASPFVDWNSQPEVSQVSEVPPLWEARVLLRTESHYEDLAEMLREKGFYCKKL